MPSQVNSLPPSLTNELSDIQRRLSAIERAPVPVNTFDRYPTAEWDPTARGVVGDNEWHAVSIANVTGMVFDRLETKFVTFNNLKGKREPELRLAAYRHSRDGGKQIVSASSTWQLIGNQDAFLGSGLIRWIHGIPHGWEYARDTDIYTVELQLRYAVGPEVVPNVRIYTIAGLSTSPTDGLETRGTFEDNGSWLFAPMMRDGKGYRGALIDLPATDHGLVQVSAMQYCAGLPASRLPDATAAGVLYYDLEFKVSRAPNLGEPAV